MQPRIDITETEQEIVMALFDVTLPRVSRNPVGQFTNLLLQALAVRRERAALKRLTEAELRDIGLTRARADREALRSFWDLPRRDGH